MANNIPGMMDMDTPFEEIVEYLTRMYGQQNRLTVVRDSKQYRRGVRLILIKWRERLELGKLWGLVGKLRDINGDIFDRYVNLDNGQTRMNRSVRQVYRPNDRRLIDFSNVQINEADKRTMVVAERYNIIMIKEGVAVMRYCS